MMNYKQHYMWDLKSLLLATDNTEYSEGAIKEAIHIAKHCDAKLYVIQVLQINPEFATEGHKEIEKMELNCRLHFDHIRELAAEENVEIESIVRRSDKPDEVIIEEAYKKKVDLIVMGRRGFTGLKRFVIGSVTAKVIVSSPCNVLVVPKGAQIKSWTILLATDGSDYSRASEDEALSMARRCPELKKFFALSVAKSESKLPETTQIIENFKKKAVEWGIEIEPIIAVGVPHEIILKIAKEKDCDLIILGTYGRKGVKKLAFGSVSEKVITYTNCAVLVAKIAKI